MTVKELISRLQSYEDTAEVILASDAEGNQLHRIEGPMKEGESLVIIWPEDDFIEDLDGVWKNRKELNPEGGENI